MCGRYTLYSDTDEIQRLFQIDINGWSAQYNIVPSMVLPVIRMQNHQRMLAMCRWGFCPSWVKDPKGHMQINARMETIREKPYFRQAFKHQRCLVLANGWFEWQNKAGQKIPFYIHGPNHHVIVFAGIWSHWGEGENSFYNFAIITTDAPAPLSHIHHRMPFVLSQIQYDKWLTAEAADVGQVLAADVIQQLKYYPVSTNVNNPRNHDRQCIEPIN